MLLSEVKPCQCLEPNSDCRRAGMVGMTGRLWELCHGVNCTPEQSLKYREFWDTNKRDQTCKYLEGETGGRQVCDSCSGKVSLKVFLCSHPNHGSTTIQGCRQCKDYQGA